MNSFISIIVNAEKSLNADKSDGAELNSWMLLLLRFTTNANEHLIVEKIDSYFAYYWQNDRIDTLNADNDFLN